MSSYRSFSLRFLRLNVKDHRRVRFNIEFSRKDPSMNSSYTLHTVDIWQNRCIEFLFLKKKEKCANFNFSSLFKALFPFFFSWLIPLIVGPSSTVEYHVSFVTLIYFIQLETKTKLILSNFDEMTEVIIFILHFTL